MPYKTTIEEFENSNEVSLLVSRNMTSKVKQVVGEQAEARWLPSHFDLVSTEPATSPDSDGLWMVLRWTSLKDGVQFKVRCKASGDLTISGQADFNDGSSKSTKIVYCRTADSSFGA